MKVLVIGLDCAAPELLLGDESLTNFRRLMAMGCYGPLESIVPPITIPAWMCMASSQDPGSLGVYGFRNRTDHSYGKLSVANSRSIRALTIWDQFAREGKRSVIIGVPPSYPPRPINGVSVGCFMTPSTAQGVFTHPPELGARIRELVGEYPVDVKGFRTEDKDWLKSQIYQMSRAHFRVVRALMQECPWDYFQFVEIGLDRMHHGFWKHHDPQHVLHKPDSPYKDCIRQYYRYLDEEVGSLLELLDEDTAVLVASDHGAQRLDGGFCVNEWLIRQGLLALHRYPEKVTPLENLDVDWSRTTCWSEGGYYARLFLNVKGREPEGRIDPADAARVRDEIKARLEATVGPDGKPLGTLAFKPEEAYRQARGIPPDLIVHFGGLLWRSIGGVGYPTIHVLENDTGPDDCNHAQHGAFILSAPACPLGGPIEGAHLLDVAPTLLELAGAEPLQDAQGRSLIAGGPGPHASYRPDEEEVIRQRLRGLGYI